MKVGVDTVHVNAQGVSGDGSVASRLIKNGMNVNALRPWIGKDGRAYMTTINAEGKPTVMVVNNAHLRNEEWVQYDTAIVREARIRLSGVNDLTSRGLVYNIANGFGKTVLESENLNDFMVAELSMDGLSRTQGDRGVFGMDYLPLPLIHSDYFFNARDLATSRNTGDAMDTTNAEMAARAVAEKMEEILFNGASSYKYVSGVIYGYTDFPNRNLYNTPANWDASGVDGPDIVADVLAMKQILINDRFYGPYTIYIPTAWETKLDADYAHSGTTNSANITI